MMSDDDFRNYVLSLIAEFELERTTGKTMGLGRVLNFLGKKDIYWKEHHALYRIVVLAIYTSKTVDEAIAEVLALILAGEIEA